MRIEHADEFLDKLQRLDRSYNLILDSFSYYLENLDTDTKEEEDLFNALRSFKDSLVISKEKLLKIQDLLNNGSNIEDNLKSIKFVYSESYENFIYTFMPKYRNFTMDMENYNTEYLDELNVVDQLKDSLLEDGTIGSNIYAINNLYKNTNEIMES